MKGGFNEETASRIAKTFNEANEDIKAVFDSANFKIENFAATTVNDPATTVNVPATYEETTVVNEETTTTPNGASTILIKSSSLMCTLLSTFLAYNL